MLRRRVTLRNRDEARQPRLRRQKIVRRRIEPVGALVEADSEKLALLVKEKREVHLERHRPRPLGDVVQGRGIARRIVLAVVRATRDLAARCGRRDEMASEIAGIDGRDVRRFEHPQVRKAIPIVKMAAQPAHRRHRRERTLETLDHLAARDESQVECGNRREQLKAEVCWRCTIGHDGSWRLLKIVGRKPLSVRIHEMIEEVPMPLAVAEHCRALRRRELQLGARHGSTEAVGDEWRRRPADRKRKHEEEVRIDRTPRRQYQPRYDGERHFSPHRRRPLSRKKLDLRGRLPLEHSTVRDERAHEGAHDPVDRNESLVRKEDDGKHGLLDRCLCVALQRGVVRSPRLFARRPRRGQCRREQPSQCECAERGDGPQGWRSGEYGPSRDEPGEHRDRHQAPS